MVDAVIIKSEREQPLGREFPEMFRPNGGLEIVEIRHGGADIRQAFRSAFLHPGGTVSGTVLMGLAGNVRRRAGFVPTYSILAS